MDSLESWMIMSDMTITCKQSLQKLIAHFLILLFKGGTQRSRVIPTITLNRDPLR